MFKHTTKESILSGFLGGLGIFIGDYFWTGGSFNGLMMGLALVVFLGFLRPHIMGEQREAREKDEREKSQS